MMLGYIGAEAAAPVLSALAAVGGAILFGWRWISKQCRTVYRAVFRIKVEEEPEEGETADTRG